MKEITLKFKKISPQGQAIGYFNKKQVFCFGVLKNETAKIRIIKQKKNKIFGKVIKILIPHKKRIKPKEKHYLSCSPFQIIDYDFEKKIKKQLIQNTLKDFQENIKIDKFIFAKQIFHYRTKLEFSFKFNKETKEINLAFFQRNDPFNKIILKNGCILGSNLMNKTANKILNILNENKIDPEILKSLIIRESKTENKILAILTVKKFIKTKISFTNEINNLNGFILNYSSFKTPATTFERILKIEGNDFLKEKIADLEIYYGYNAFFQNNLELFQIALEKIKNDFNFYQKPKLILELFSGVGTIGLSLKDFASKIIGIENQKEAILWAQFNKKINQVNNYFPILNSAEKSDEFLNKAEILIVDPPRSGLNQKLIKKIIQYKIKKIIYLSCQFLTQLKDYQILKNYYKLKNFYVFDFYPRTPHLETLMILEKK